MALSDDSDDENDFISIGTVLPPFEEGRLVMFLQLNKLMLVFSGQDWRFECHTHTNKTTNFNLIFLI